MMRLDLAVAALALMAAPLIAQPLTAAAPPSRPVAITLPDADGPLPERYGVSSVAVNANCLACHSAAMISLQPRFNRVEWAGTIAKMRDVYGAPIDPVDDAAILDWLVAD